MGDFGDFMQEFTNVLELWTGGYGVRIFRQRKGKTVFSERGYLP